MLLRGSKNASEASRLYNALVVGQALRVQPVGVRNAPPRSADSKCVDDFDVLVLPGNLQVFTVYDLIVPDSTPNGRGTLFMYLGIHLSRVPVQAAANTRVPFYYFLEWPLYGRQMVKRFACNSLPMIYKQRESAPEYAMSATSRSIGSPDFYTQIVSQDNMLSGQYYYIAIAPHAQARVASGIYRYIATFRDCREDAPDDEDKIIDKHVMYHCSDFGVRLIGEYAIECVRQRRSHGPPPTSWLPLNYQCWP